MLANLRCSDCGGRPVVTPPEDSVHWCQRCVDAAEWEMAMWEDEQAGPCHFLTDVVPALVQQANLERWGWGKRDG